MFLRNVRKNDRLKTTIQAFQIAPPTFMIFKKQKTDHGITIKQGPSST